MINFIIDEIIYKDIIDKIMLNYNYEYQVNLLNDIEENTGTNIYLLTFTKQKDKSINKIEKIRKELDDWSSIIILLTDNINIKYEIYDKGLYLLDIINNKLNIEISLKEDILKSLKSISKRGKILKYTYKNIIYNIPFQDITYIENESINKRCIIKTKTISYYIPGSLSKVFQQLDTRFEKCSRSYIINLDKVRRYNIKNNEIELEDKFKLYEISRNKKKRISNYLRGLDTSNSVEKDIN